MFPFNSRFAEAMQVCAAINPVDLATAANNGDWVSLKGYEGCAIIFFKGIGTAGDDPVLTLRQATDVAATGAKALPFTRIDYKLGTLTSVGTYTTVTQAAANTYTDAVSAEAAGIFIIDVKMEDMDIDNNFDCVQFQIPDTGTAAQIGAALYLLYGPRSTPLVSAIVD